MEVFIATAITAMRRRSATGTSAAPHSRTRRPLSSDYVMTFLVEMEDPGLVVLPTHRLVPGGIPAGELRAWRPISGSRTCLPIRWTGWSTIRSG